jgi:hypothetical protein
MLLNIATFFNRGTVKSQFSNDLDALSARAKIMEMQRQCQLLPNEHRMDESPPLKNWLAPGVYCREIHLPSDSVVVGRIHRHDHMNIISQGSVTVYTEFGEETLTAPASFISKAGTKRIVFTHDAAIWTTIHPNPDNEQNIDILENRYTAAEYAELGMLVGNLLEG